MISQIHAQQVIIDWTINTDSTGIMFLRQYKYEEELIQKLVKNKWRRFESVN